MARALTVHSYLADGDPEGIIFTEVSNWTGLSIKIYRKVFSELKNTPELRRPGLYLLLGYAVENITHKLVYVGEANNLMERLQKHQRDPDKQFAEMIVCFCSKDDNLTVSHTKYLEFKTIELFTGLFGYNLMNRNAGTIVSVPKRTRDEMDAYYDNMLLVLLTSGIIQRRSAAIASL